MGKKRKPGDWDPIEWARTHQHADARQDIVDYFFKTEMPGERVELWHAFDTKNSRRMWLRVAAAIYGGQKEVACLVWPASEGMPDNMVRGLDRWVTNPDARSEAERHRIETWMLKNARPRQGPANHPYSARQSG